jgi:hypothetical protein
VDYIILILYSFIAALISGVGFGGSLLLLPIVTDYVGTEIAVPVLTLAQLIGNISHMGTGIKQIDWKAVGWFGSA